MATSGTYVFDATSDQIITSALRIINVLSEEQTLADVPTAVRTNARFRLNVLIKSLVADGMPLWAINDMTIPYSYFTGNVASIALSNASVPMAAPLKVLQGESFTANNANGIEMNIMTHYDYNSLSQSSNSLGTPVNLYYRPLNGSGELYVWPAPIGQVKTQGKIVITYQRQLQDLGDGTDTLDFPPYWTDVIIIGTAIRLAPEYGVPGADRAILKSEYKELHEQALGFGTEEGSLRIRPDWSYYGEY